MNCDRCGGVLGHARTCVHFGLVTEMTEQNKYGGYAEEPFDAKKARELTDKKIRTTHFAPISWALQIIKTAAERGDCYAFLQGHPWNVDAGCHVEFRDEMIMHLRDRGFRTIREKEDGQWYVKVEW